MACTSGPGLVKALEAGLLALGLLSGCSVTSREGLDSPPAWMALPELPGLALVVSLWLTLPPPPHPALPDPLGVE